MSAKRSESSSSPAEKGKTESESREERLAAALRENLRRRKEQRRGREAPPDPAGPDKATND